MNTRILNSTPRDDIRHARDAIPHPSKRNLRLTAVSHILHFSLHVV